MSNDFDTTLDPQGFDSRRAGDDKLFVVFTMKAVKNGFKSEQEGRPIFDDVAHVRIQVPGDKTQITERESTPDDQERWPKQWERFQKQMTQSPEGTPVEQWPQLTVSLAMELKAMGIMTVEQLAGISDTSALKFMGGMELRKRADAFLKVSKDTAEAQRLAVANEELEQRLASQDAIIRDLAAQVKALRPSKEAQA